MEGQPIDRLEIQVESKASKAVQQLNNMEKALRRVKVQLSAMDSSKLNLSKNVKVKVDNASLKSATAKIKKDFSNVGKDFVFKGNLKELETEIGNLEKKLVGLKAKQAKYDTVGTSKESKAYQNLAYDISMATNKLDVLRKKQQNMKAKPVSFYDKPGWFENLQANGGKTTATPTPKATAQTNVAATKPSVPSMKYDTKEIADFIENYANGSEKISKASNKAKETIKSTTPEIKKLADTSSKLKNVKLPKNSANGLKALTNGFASLGHSISSCKKGLSNFGKSIKNSAFKGLQKKLEKAKFNMRMIGMQLKFMIFGKVFTAIFENLKTGFDDLAKWSNKNGTAFNKNLTSMYSNLKLLGRSLATAFEPLVNVCTPYINAFITKLVELSNKVAQLFAALTGSKTWTKATYQSNNYADSVSDAAKSTKDLGKAQRDLMGFDEINKLSDHSSSASAGAGAGGNEVDGSTAFKTQNVSSNISKLAKEIKDAWKKADFTGIGKTIATKMNKTLSSIDWSNANAGADKVAKSLATLINGFVGKANWKLVGSTIAKSINTVILGINTFLTTTNWKNVGNALAKTLNGFIKDFKFNDLGKTLGNAINAVASTAYNFVKNVEWGELGTKLVGSLNTFLETVDFKKIGKTIGSAISGVCKFVKNFLKDADFKKIAKDVGNFISGIWSELDIGDVAPVVAGLIGIKLGKKALTTAFSKISFGALKTIVVSKIGNVLKSKAISSSLSGALSGLSGTVSEAVSAGAGNGLGAKLATLLSKSGAGAIVAGKLALCIGVAIGGFKLGEWLNKNTKIGKWADALVTAVGDGLTKGPSIISELEKWLKNGIKSFKKNIKSKDWWMKTLGFSKDGKNGLGAGNGKTALTIDAKLKPDTKDLDSAVKKATKGDTKKFVFKTDKTQFDKDVTTATTKGTKNVSLNADTNNFDNQIKAETADGNKKIKVDADTSKFNSDTANATKSEDKSINLKAVKTASYENAVGSAKKPITAKVKLTPATPISTLAKQWEKDFKNNFKPKWEFKINGKNGTVSQTINSAYWVPAKADGGIFKNGKWSSISKYAMGGLPNSGQMFVAREAGPELVGKIGSSTAVVNNDQIVASVSNGVAKAVGNVAASVINTLNNSKGGNGNNVYVILDGKDITQSCLRTAKGMKTTNGGVNPFMAI